MSLDKEEASIFEKEEEAFLLSREEEAFLLVMKNGELEKENPKKRNPRRKKGELNLRSKVMQEIELRAPSTEATFQ